MNVLLIGGGGREHVIAKYIARSSKIENFYAIPGNGRISKYASCVNISLEDIDGIINFARDNAIDFAISASDNSGIIERLENIGVKCFGSSQNAKTGKISARELMTKYSIPQPKYRIFTKIDPALSFAATSDCPIVIKSDSGVTVAENFKQAREAVMSYTKISKRILIEEFLRGTEVTVSAFTDGKTLTPMISSLNYKRAYDGGMGVIAPNFYYTDKIADECMSKIFLPAMNAINNEGNKFKGCIYFELMLTSDGPKVIDYKFGFGDPEAEAVLPLLDSDLFEIMLAVCDERLDGVDVKFKNAASCCVVCASQGYPGNYLTGCEIDFGDAEKIPGVEIFHAGTRLEGGKYFTSGGRVLAVNAVDKDLESARERVYEAVSLINFDGIRYRTDIGTM